MTKFDSEAKLAVTCLEL